MSVIQCSMCRRAAAWLIDAETFCEALTSRQIDQVIKAARSEKKNR